MFGSFLNKLKDAAKGIATTAVKADNKDLMEAMVAGAVLVAYVDGELEAEEVAKCKAIIGASSQLSAFGDEPMSVFDKYCDKVEASKRMGKLDLMKEISDIKGNLEGSQRVLIMAIEVADADGEIDQAEMDLLNEIAKKLDLKLSDYL